MLVYQQYCLRKMSSSEERTSTLAVLASLLPRLTLGCRPHAGELPLLLTVDDVRVLKAGLRTLLALLQKKPASASVVLEIARLTRLKDLIERTFSTTQD